MSGGVKVNKEISVFSMGEENPYGQNFDGMS